MGDVKIFMKKFDLKQVYNEDRPLSWSGISAFEWNPHQWYHKYVVHGKCTYAKDGKGVDFCVVVGFADPNCPVVKKTPELIFGSFVDLKIQEDPKYLPEIVRYSVMQHEMRCTYNNIPLLGFADTFEPPVTGDDNFSMQELVNNGEAAIRDYKTGRKPWDQKRADETGQLTMYLGMEYLINKIRPEDFECFIDWLPTHIQDGQVVFVEPFSVKTFKTKRTMHQVLTFFQRIEDTWRAMQSYAEQQEELSVTDIKDWN